MVIWHNTGDASRIPENILAGDEVVLWIGSHPIESGQSVWVELTLLKTDGREFTAAQPARWHSNNDQRNNSYWIVEIGSFDHGDHLEYRACGKNATEQAGCTETFCVDIS